MKKALLLFVALTCFTTLAPAKSKTYKLNEAVLTQWKQPIPEKAVKEVVIWLRRETGSNKTFVNLRFGREGQTMDGGKRVYLKDGNWKEVRWNGAGWVPNGKPMILNTYNGSVRVDFVRIVWL